MSFESSNKRSHDMPANTGDDNTTKRLRISHSNNDGGIAGCFANIPAECCVHILHFLEVEDLANAAQVSRRFNEDSVHPSLPRNRTAMLTCVRRMEESTGVYSASPLSLLQKLMGKGLSQNSWRFDKVKITGHNLLENVSIPEVLDMLPGPLMLRHVKVLDLSFPSDEFRKGAQLKASIPAILAFSMPFLREIDLSNANVPESALRCFTNECRALEKVTWNNNHTCTWISGDILAQCDYLKELYMDDSRFSYTSCIEGISLEEEEGGNDACILFHCNTKLERVSLRNLKLTSVQGLNIPQPHPSLAQNRLIKFVRLTPSLRWFRSDLSPENVAVLQAERPEVTFA
jgi:hypothetical protein